MFEFDQRAPCGAREREDLCPDPGILPENGGEITFDFGQAFTMEQVAEKLGICLRQVQAHRKAGSLVAFDVGRGKERGDWRVLDEDLDGFVRRRKSGVVGTVFMPPEAAPHRKPDPEPKGYAARRAARIHTRET